MLHVSGRGDKARVREMVVRVAESLVETGRDATAVVSHW